MSNDVPLTPRQKFLRDRQRRQNKVFAILVMSMAGALAIALILLSGLVSLPFGNEFSAKVSYATAGQIPCPSEGAMPSAPASVHVQVLNGTSRPGIAGSATEILRELGFQADDPQNAGQDYPGSVEISSGPRAVDDAWTVARLFPGARVTLTQATDRRVLITLGAFYDKPIIAEDAARAASNKDPLEKPKHCLPVDPAEQESQSEAESTDTPASDATESGVTDTPQSPAQ